MPTGYTGDIYEGKNVSGADFIRKCARAFGAFAHMRDHSLDAPYVERKPDEFSLKQYHAAMERLERFKAMTLEEAEKEIAESYQRTVASQAKIRKEKEELQARYESTLNEVKEWEVPTEDHQKLKDYAIEQLEGSIKFDCNMDHMVEPVKEDPQTWLNDMIEHTEKSAKRDWDRYQESIKGIETINQWVKDLEESLK